jgi:hypothetical protein
MNKTGRGQWQKGISGNPGGRPRVIASLRAAAREYTAMALATLAEIAKKGKSEAARVAAAGALLDRGFGRPTQSIEVEVLLNKRLDEMSPEELAALEARLNAIDEENDHGQIH